MRWRIIFESGDTTLVERSLKSQLSSTSGHQEYPGNWPEMLHAAILRHSSQGTTIGIAELHAPIPVRAPPDGSVYRTKQARGACDTRD